MYKTTGSPDVLLGQAIWDNSPALVAGRNTSRTFSSEQCNFKLSSIFEIVVDVVVVLVVSIVVFGLRPRKSKALRKSVLMRNKSKHLKLFQTYKMEPIY